MKLFLVSILATLSISSVAYAEGFDREYAFLRLLDMGFEISEEQMGEMFKHGIFVLGNSEVCSALDAQLYDDSGESCLLQVKEDGSIGSFYSDNPNALYE